MRRLAVRAVAALAFVAALAMVAGAFAPVDSGSGPYVSALLDLTQAAMAAPQCPHKGCVSPIRCGHVTGAFGCTVAGGACEAGICR